MTQSRKTWALARDRLAAAAQALGYPEEFAELLARQLGSPMAIDRMTAYLAGAHPTGVEMIVDEMLAIRADADAWRKKKEGQEAQASYTYWLNSEERRRNLED